MYIFLEKLVRPSPFAEKKAKLDELTMEMEWIGIGYLELKSKQNVNIVNPACSAA